MPNVAWPWQNIGPTYTRVHVLAPAIDVRERTTTTSLLCMYLYRAHTLKTRARGLVCAPRRTP